MTVVGAPIHTPFASQAPVQAFQHAPCVPPLEGAAGGDAHGPDAGDAGDAGVAGRRLKAWQEEMPTGQTRAMQAFRATTDYYPDLVLVDLRKYF